MLTIPPLGEVTALESGRSNRVYIDPLRVQGILLGLFLPFCYS